MNVFMMYVGKLVGMCKLCFMNMAKFCGYVHGYICGYWQILWVLWKNFVGHVRIYLCMKLWEFFLGHVEIFFLHGYGKIWWLYGYVINLVVVTFWWGIDLILWWWGIDCENIFWYGNFLVICFWLWKLFWLCGNGVVNFAGLDV